jgi:hypothetical protein
VSQEFKGQNGSIIVEPNKVTIKHSKFLGMGKGNKEIMMRSISGIQLKKSGFLSGIGYIEILFSGGDDRAKRGLQATINDENTITIVNDKQFEEMSNAKDLIESYITNAGMPVKNSSPSPMDEIKKAAELRDAGIISQEEFEQKKKQLLGL